MKSALKGIRVIEMAGLAPSPFCGRILSDFGADIIRVDRPNAPDLDRLASGKKSIIIDVKKPNGLSLMKKLTASADIFIDPYRPGVMEKSGLGPKELLKENDKLIYARLTGFGQDGPLSHVAGHDINYVSISGVLSKLGRKEHVPTPPINLLADFAGGGLVCALGIMMALYERRSSGKGQIVDSSMSEGCAYVASWLFATNDLWIWNTHRRGENWLDSGAHFYDTYETKDNKFMSVGAIEPQFYRKFITKLGLDVEEVEQFDDFEEMKKIIFKQFKQKTRDEWCKVFDGTDACVTPILSFEEAAQHPHNVSRDNYRKCDDHWEPNPAPKLSRTPGVRPEGPTQVLPGRHTKDILQQLGYKTQEIHQLIEDEVVVFQSNSSKL